MKRILATFFLAAFLGAVLVGCAAQETSFHKAQQVSVTAADSTLLRTITDQEEIDALITALYPDSWTMATLPEGARCLGTLCFLQEKTLHFGESSTDGTLHQVAKLTVFEDGFVCLNTAGIESVFSMSAEDSLTMADLFAE